uniref:Fibrinogen C-terminal domain-containing protein n=1 Tax=Parastrongyloides trichosuri TaxID=131310 RepID=A0A0N4ZZ67_PARTI
MFIYMDLISPIGENIPWRFWIRNFIYLFLLFSRLTYSMSLIPTFEAYSEHMKRCGFGMFDCNPDDDIPTCIPFANVRDCIKDCPNGEDEVCGRRQTLCDTVINWDIYNCGKCIDEGKDEVYCIDSIYKRLCNETSTVNCMSTNNCIPYQWLMDGYDDCGDSSDEDVRLSEVIGKLDMSTTVGSHLFSKKPHPEKLQEKHKKYNVSEDYAGFYQDGIFSCKENLFKCINSTQCIEVFKVLDGVEDCEDGSDENYCKKYLPGCKNNCGFRSDHIEFVCQCQKPLIRMSNGVCASNGSAPPVDCADYRVFYKNVSPGIYKMPARNWLASFQNENNFNVLCNFAFLGGGWTVIMQRHININNSIINNFLNFNRSWNQFAKGFGEIDNNEEFWLGNDKIHILTNKPGCTQELGVLFETTATKEKIFLKYDHFQIKDEFSCYELKIGPLIYTSNILAYDILGQHNGAKFSTYDRRVNKFCPPSSMNPWWSHIATCTPDYLTSSPIATKMHKGLSWGPFRIKKIIMMIRTKKFPLFSPTATPVQFDSLSEDNVFF